MVTIAEAFVVDVANDVAKDDGDAAVAEDVSIGFTADDNIDTDSVVSVAGALDEVMAGNTSFKIGSVGEFIAAMVAISDVTTSHSLNALDDTAAFASDAAWINEPPTSDCDDDDNGSSTTMCGVSCGPVDSAAFAWAFCSSAK